MEAERPEPHESVDDRQFVDLREQLLSENNEVEKCRQPNANTNVVGIPFPSREIKFRAWDGEKLIYPTNGWYEKVSLPNHLSYQTLQLGQAVRLLTVTQFTGLKDIYEGDILKPPYGDKLYLVFYNPEKASFMMKIIGNEYEEYYSLLKWEVIGNIFENPELLQSA